MSQNQEDQASLERLAWISEACCPLVNGEYMLDHKPEVTTEGEPTE